MRRVEAIRLPIYGCGYRRRDHHGARGRHRRTTRPKIESKSIRKDTTPSRQRGPHTTGIVPPAISPPLQSKRPRGANWLWPNVGSHCVPRVHLDRTTVAASALVCVLSWEGVDFPLPVLFALLHGATPLFARRPGPPFRAAGSRTNTERRWPPPATFLKWLLRQTVFVGRSRRGKTDNRPHTVTLDPLNGTPKRPRPF